MPANKRTLAYREYKNDAIMLGLPVNTSLWRQRGFTADSFVNERRRIMTPDNMLNALNRGNKKFKEGVEEAHKITKKVAKSIVSAIPHERLNDMKMKLLNKIKNIKRKLPSKLNEKTPFLKIQRYYDTLKKNKGGINEYVLLMDGVKNIVVVDGETHMLDGENTLDIYEKEANENYKGYEDNFGYNWIPNFVERMKKEMKGATEYFYIGAEIYVYSKSEKRIHLYKSPSINAFLPKSFGTMDFVEYIVLKNYHTQEYPDNMLYAVDIRVLPIKNMKMNDLKMKGIPLTSMLLESFNDIKIKQRYGHCVTDYTHEMIHDKPGYAKLSKDNLVEQFKLLGIDNLNGISSQEFMKWKAEYGKYLNVYICDPFKRIFNSSMSINSAHTVATLIFMVNNGHLYPIVNKELNYYLNNVNSHKDKVLLGKIEWSTEFGENEYIKVDGFNYAKYVECKDYANWGWADAPVEDQNKKICVVDNDITRKDENGDSYIDFRGLYFTMIDVIEKHHVTIDDFIYDGQGQLKAFVHPINKMVFVANDDLNERIATCKTIFEEHAFDCFKFKNQSFCSIARNLQRVLIGELPKSTNNEMARLQLDYYSPTAMIQTIYQGDWKKLSNVYGCDIFKCYSSVMYNMADDYPVYSIHDSIKEYDDSEIVCGEYYIDSTKLKCGLTLPNAFYHYGLVKFLLENKYIKKSSIKKMIKASTYLSGKLFRPLIKYVYKKFDLFVAKQLINTFIGSLNMKYDKVCEGCICTDEDTVQALFWRAIEQNMEIKFNCTNNIYLCKQYKKTRQLEDNCSIWRAIISGGIQSLLILVSKLENEKSLLIGVNTDSVFIQSPNPIVLIDDDSKPLKNLGKYREEDIKPKRYHPYVAKEEIKFEPHVFTGVCYNGIGGSGKTQRMGEDIVKSHNSNEKYIAMSFTNNACRVLKERVNGMLPSFVSVVAPNEGVTHKQKNDIDILTFSSILTANGEISGKMINALTKYDTIYIDEFYMTPNEFVTIIYLACMKNPQIKVVISGDPNQCNSCEDGGKVYDYTLSDAVKQICPNLVVCEYIENSGRYNMKLKLILDELLEHGTISHKFSPVAKDKNVVVNLCKFNNTRVQINTPYCNAWAHDSHDSIEITHHYQSKEETYKCFVGMPVMCTQTIKKYNMCNSQKFVIEEITDKYVIVNGQQFTIVPTKGEYCFGYCFVPAYCVTVYKYQGDKIDKPYNVLDAYCMSKKELYTALSRATNDSLIHIDNLRNHYINVVDERQYKLHPIKCKSGIIYEISFDDGSYYVGSTTTSIEQRLSEHLLNPNCVVYAHRHLNPKINQIAKINYLHKADLFCAEQKHIKLYESEGKKLINVLLVTKPDDTVVRKIEINKYVELYPINDTGDSYEIKVRRNGKIVHKCIRYGKRVTKQDAHLKMIEIQKNLNNESNIEINKSSDLYPIHDLEDRFEIKVCHNDKYVQNCVYYDKNIPKSKKEAYAKIVEIQKNLNNV